jgi:hypothetical protein
VARIFISYSRKDRNFVDELATYLNRIYNNGVWYDKRAVGGGNFWQEIVDQISKCNVFLYLLSDDSINSTFCNREMERARGAQKRVIPVRIKDTQNTPPHISILQIIDMSSGITAANLTELLVAINYRSAPRKLYLWLFAIIIVQAIIIGFLFFTRPTIGTTASSSPLTGIAQAFNSGTSTPPPSIMVPDTTPTHTSPPIPSQTLTATAVSTPRQRPTQIEWGDKTLYHHPELLAEGNYVGDLGIITAKRREINDRETFEENIDVEIDAGQILMIFGAEARLHLPDGKKLNMGSASRCFIVIARGPFRARLDLNGAAIEPHQAGSGANTLRWAAAKARDMKEVHRNTCGKNIEIWVDEP